MKKILLAMTAASALCVGVPAQAQVGDILGGIFGGGSNYDSRLRQLESRIQNGLQRGTIDRREGDRLWSQLQDIRARENQYDDGGYSREERYDLDQRFADLERRISDAERGGNDGYNGGGYNGGGWDTGGNDGQFDARIRNLRDRIERGVQNRQLTRNEAQNLRGQLREINRLEQQYDNDGISRGERDDLRNRIERLRRDLQNALRNGDNRGGDNRYDDRSDRDDRYYDNRRDSDDD